MASTLAKSKAKASTSRLPLTYGLGSFSGPLKFIKRHLLNKVVGFMLGLAHESLSCRRINSGSHSLGYTVLKGLDNHPALKTMMGAQTQ